MRRTGLAGLALVLMAALAAAAVASQGTARASPAATAVSEQEPPPVVLRSAAGRQRAVQGSFCVTIPGDEVTLVHCADFVPEPKPEWLSVVRPREHVVIRVRGASSARGSVQILRRGCENRAVRGFTIARPTRRWVVQLNKGKYLLNSFVEFETSDGRSGTSFSALGLHVSESRALDVVPAGDSLACGS